MNKKEVKEGKKKERESKRFGSLSLSGLNFKALSYCCFKNKGFSVLSLDLEKIYSATAFP